MPTTAKAMTRRRICLLGGTGFVGRNLAARLAADGCEVRILTRRPERHRALLVLPTVTLVEADIHDQGALERHFDGQEAVINLVGILNESGRDGSGFRHAHVDLPRKVVAACRAAGVPRLLHMSALKADAENGPSHYLRSKGEGEALVRAANGPDLAVTIFQPSVIFGPDDSFINRFAGLLRLPFLLFPVPRPNARFAPVYVGDVCEAFVRSLWNRETWNKTYQLCGPKVYSLLELVSVIARTLGVRRKIVGMTESLAKVQARIGDFIPGKPFSSDNYLSLTVNSLCDSDGLGRLGITPTAGETIMPGFLGNKTSQSRYNRYRKSARGR